MEKWKDIEGYEGLYQISNMGNVRSLDRIISYKNNCKHRKLSGKLMRKNYDSNTCYYKISLCKNGIPSKIFIHRLVAQAFIPNPDNLQVVNHKNSIRTDNCVDNLEWCTVRYNNEHSGGILKAHEANKKPVIQLTKNGDFVTEYESVMDAARKTGIDCSQISGCCKNKKYYKSAGGYIWKFKD